MNKDTNINFRTTEKMKEQLQKLATSETRSLSTMIEVLINEALAARKKQK